MNSFGTAQMNWLHLDLMRGTWHFLNSGNGKKQTLQRQHLKCLKWAIEGVSETGIENYNNSILDPALIKAQIEDPNFDDHYSIFTVDITAIATGFAQLVDEGKIDPENKDLIRIALSRQFVWAEIITDWEYKNEYKNRLDILLKALEKA